MKIQRKWRRSWQRGKPHWAIYRPAKQKKRAVKNNVIQMASRVAKRLLPPVAAASILFSTMTGAYASPQGGQVVSGAGSIAQKGNTTNITQTTDKMGINWQSFNIAANEKVNFYQPGASSVALNRVLGNNASSIYGQLNANGKVFLINPNGVLFAKGAQVNVGGLVASTLSLSDKDFQTGKYNFTGNGGSVVNQGTITATDGGSVALLGGQVSNQGVIVANKGTVALGTGNAVTLDMDGDGMLSLAVNQSAVNALAENKNLMEADGGKVIMTARAADILAATAVNNSGVVRAKSINAKNGVILLDGGDNGTVQVSGTLDASGKASGQTGGTIKILGNNISVANAALDASGDQGGGTILVGGNYQGSGTEQHAATTTIAADVALKADAVTSGSGGKVVVWADKTTDFNGAITGKGGSENGNGGKVETSGKHLTVGSTARVTTTAAKGMSGNWLLDPANFTITSGSGAQTDSGIGADTLAANLGGSNIGISTATIGSEAGDINVNAAVSWSANTKLTLSAANNINVSANITASGDNAGMVLTYGSGGKYSLGSGAKITLSGNSPTLSIGGQIYTVLNANNYKSQLPSLTLGGQYALGCDVDASATNQAMSPIGTSTSAFTGIFDGLGHTVSKLTISGGTSSNIGLFGYTGSTAVIRNISLTNVNITGSGSSVGALVGYNNGTIENCNSAGTVSGTKNVGGLVGDNYGTITASTSAVSVTVSTNGKSMGGLAGANEDSKASISDSSSSGTVIRTSQSSKYVYTGGLVGYNSAKIANSFSSSTVESSTNYTGGLVGYNTGGQITGSWSTGNIIGTNYVGGLVGNNDSGTISVCYSTGTVKGVSWVGGLVGYNKSTISGSWHKTGSVTSSNSYIGGLVGWNAALIEDSYNDSAVTMTGTSDQIYVGGLIGYNTGTVTGADKDKSYSSGSVTSNGGTVGGLIGYNNSLGAVSGYHSTGSVSGGAAYVGGLIGYNTSTISGCYNTSDVKSTGSYTGGLIGYNTGTVKDTSYSTGLVSSTAGNVGGLIGYNTGAVSDSYSTGSVTGGGNNIGGLIGYNTAAITSCYSSGNVTLPDYIESIDYWVKGENVGGLVGSNNGGSITNCYATGTVLSKAFVQDSSGCYYAIVGGLVGYNWGNVNDSYSTGTVTSESNGMYTGGLLGEHNGGTVSHCYHTTGKVTSRADHVGGLIGGITTNGAVQYCYNTADVAGVYQVGGLAGFSQGSLQYSYNTGKVTGDEYVGGLVGENIGFNKPSQGLIQYCYTTGTVHGGNYAYYVGGLVGHNNYGGVINQCYNVGSISVNSRYPSAPQSNMVGGLVGDNENSQGDSRTSKVTSCYWSTDNNSGLSAIGVNGDSHTLVSGVGGLTLTQMEQSTNYSSDWKIATVGGDISAIWRIYDGYSYPLLRDFLKPLTVTAESCSKLYDGIAVTTGPANYSLDRTVDTSLLGTGKVYGNGNEKNAGTYYINLYSTDNQGYDISYSGAALTISKVALTVTGSTAADKTYNGTVDAAITVGSLSGFVGSETVSAMATGVFDSQNAGSRTATASYTLADGTNGGLASNYSLADTAGLTATIGKKALTVTGSTAADKTYNGTVDAAITVGSLSGFVGSETVSATATGVFDSQNAGSRTATASYTLADGENGGLASNYSLADTAGLTATIGKKALTVTGSTAADKTYNGTADAAITVGSLSGFVGSETVSATATGVFDSQNAGSRTATASYTLADGTNGGLASNYSLADTAGLTATIAAKTVSLFAGKTYDGTTDLTGKVAIITGVGSETLTYRGAAASSKNVVDNGSNYISAITLQNASDGSGGLAANYQLPALDSANAAVTIGKKDLAVTGSTAADKTYDGTANAVIAVGSLSGFVSGETVSATATGVFDSKNAGSRTATASYTLADGTNGGLASNYSLADTTGLTATIGKKALTVTGSTAADKTYDGTSSAVITVGSLSGLVGGETVSATATGAFDSQNAGDNQKVLVVYILSNGINGGLASNYSLDDASVTANIIKKTLTMTGITVANKVYDGMVTATVMGYGLSGFVGTETVTVNGTGTFEDKNAGINKIVNITGITLSNGANGGLASNYGVSPTATAYANIGKRDLAVTAAGQNKVYDGTVGATVTYGDNRVAGDVLFIGGTGSFGDKNVGTGKTVTISGITISGDDSSNYTYNTTAPTTADITPRSLTITAAANTKTYDGTTSAAATPAITSGGSLQTGDSFTSLTETYDNKNSGSNKTLTPAAVINDGNNGSNYNVTYVNSMTGAIDKAAITPSLVGTVSKTYDGNKTAVLHTSNYQLDGVVAGDSVSLDNTAAGQYNDETAGKNKLVTADGIALTGADAGNYTLSTNQPAAAIGEIIQQNTSQQIDQVKPKPIVDTTPQGTGPVTQPVPVSISIDTSAQQGGTSGSVAPSQNTAAGTGSTQTTTSGTSTNGGATAGSSQPAGRSSTSSTANAAAGNAALSPTVRTAAPASTITASIEGNTRSYSVGTTGNTFTISAFGGSNSGTTAMTAPAKNIVVTTVGAGASQTAEIFSLTQGNGTVSLTSNPSPAAALPEPKTNNSSVSSFTITSASGTVAEFSVTYTDGALSIKPLNKSAAAMTADNGGDGRKLLIGMGVLTVQEKLGVSVNNIESVYIHTDSPE
ncbi:MAG: YDG domain-containing protein [Veillonellales bacterium]